MDYLEVLAKPKANTINQGLTSPSAEFMIANIGHPRTDYTGDCQAPNVAAFKKLVATQSIGPFRATGLKPALASLKTVMDQVNKELPDLYPLLGSAGMLCCRYRRVGGGKLYKKPSNHSFGTAIDVTIKGPDGKAKLDTQGDNKVYRGLLILCKYFNAARWYWGVSFPVEDGMHFEASKELVQDWKKQGLI